MDSASKNSSEMFFLFGLITSGGPLGGVSWKTSEADISWTAIDNWILLTIKCLTFFIIRLKYLLLNGNHSPLWLTMTQLTSSEWQIIRFMNKTFNRLRAFSNEPFIDNMNIITNEVMYKLNFEIIDHQSIDTNCQHHHQKTCDCRDLLRSQTLRLKEYRKSQSIFWSLSHWFYCFWHMRGTRQ